MYYLNKLTKKRKMIKASPIITNTFCMCNAFFSATFKSSVGVGIRNCVRALKMKQSSNGIRFVDKNVYIAPKIIINEILNTIDLIKVANIFTTNECILNKIFIYLYLLQNNINIYF